MPLANEGIPELKIPGILLAAFAGTWGVGLMIMTILNALGIVENDEGVRLGGNNPIVNTIGAVFVMGYFLALMAGAIGLMQGKISHALAWVVAILSSIPCCSPWVCLGMVPGIWIITQLGKPEVKARFTR